MKSNIPLHGQSDHHHSGSGEKQLLQGVDHLGAQEHESIVNEREIPEVLYFKFSYINIT